MPHDQAQPTPVLSTSERESSRPRSTPAARLAANRRRRLRYVFFGLAAAWGFAAGSVAVLAGLDAVEVPTATRGLTMRLGLAAVVALVGGFVVALAYREVVRRGP